jgi:hypothetical protein
MVNQQNNSKTTESSTSQPHAVSFETNSYIEIFVFMAARLDLEFPVELKWA